MFYEPNIRLSFINTKCLFIFESFYFPFDQYLTFLNVFVSFCYQNNSILKLYYRRTCIIFDIPIQHFLQTKGLPVTSSLIPTSLEWLKTYSQHGSATALWSVLPASGAVLFTKSRRRKESGSLAATSDISTWQPDASSSHGGAALHQCCSTGGPWEVLGFFSRKPDKAQVSYSAFDCELLAASSLRGEKFSYGLTTGHSHRH